MKKLLLAPACVAAMAYAVLATNQAPQVVHAEEKQAPATIVPGMPEEFANFDPDAVNGDIVVTAAGADVIVGALSVTRWGQLSGKNSYSVGTTSCNVGTVNLNWIQNSNQHPVIAQNLYRISSDGMLMHIGNSYLKHGFCALQQSGLCGTCTPAGGGCFSQLGVGCFDPYTAGRNGSQTLLGPKWQVNANTGFFNWPYSQQGQTGDVLFKRLQADNTDINPAMNSGAVYYVEGHYVSPDDAAASNQDNNASVMRVAFSGTDPNFNMSAASSTIRMTSAIEQWPVHTTGAQVVDVRVPGEGLMHAGAYVRDNGDGTWTYIYAVHNMNSHISAYSFSVPVDAGVNVTNAGVHFSPYHSGEPYTNGAWNINIGGGQVEWTADATFAANPNANALRWSFTNTFWFTADVGPEDGTVSIGLFRTPGNVDTALPVPSAAANLLGDMNCDGFVTVSDISGFVLALTDPAGYASSFPGCDINNADINGDTFVTVADIAGFVALLAP